MKKNRTCRQCQKKIIDDKNESLLDSRKPIQYSWNNHDVCKECFDEISAEVGRGWKYEDFWQVEKKYPLIFKQGMYINK